MSNLQNIERNFGISRVVTWAEKYPIKAFALFLLLHGVIWTLLPTLSNKKLPTDVLEGLMYGREWQVGYGKLPPLPWYIIEITHQLIDRDIGYYALSQFSVLIAFMFIFLTAAPIVGYVAALCSILIIDGATFFSINAVAFNHNVAQLPLWAFAGYAFRLALNTEKTKYWIGLGIAIGLGFWAKYFTLVLAIPLSCFLLFDRHARKTFKTAGPWLALMTALICLSRFGIKTQISYIF